MPNRWRPATSPPIRRGDLGSAALPGLSEKPPRRAFWSVSFGVLVVFMASAIPTPLYPLYQDKLGFSGVVLSLIFSLYVCGTLAVLLLVGNLSDNIGRRPVLLLALASALLGSLAFLALPGISGLLVGRTLHGIAVGVFGAAGAATLADLEPHGDRSRAALFATVANMLGLVVGSLLSGELAQYAPLPLRLPWLVEIAFLMVATILIWNLSNDWRRPSPGWWRPQPLHLPKSIRRLFVAAAAAGFSLSAIMGLFLSLVPDLVGSVLHLSGPARSGEIVALLFGASAAAELLLRHLPTRTAISGGLIAMIAGLASIIAAELMTSVPLFLLGTLGAGIGQGLTLTGALAAVNLASPSGQRSEIVSSLYVFNYLGLAVPVLGVGAVSSIFGLLPATIGFAVVISGIALFAWVAVQGVDASLHPDMPAHRALAGFPRLS